MKKKCLLILGLLPVLAFTAGNTIHHAVLDGMQVQREGEAAYVGWDYNAKTDLMVDTLYNDDSSRTLSDTDVTDTGFSYVSVTATKAQDRGDSIYKYADGVNKNNSTLTLKMRTAGANYAKISISGRGGSEGTQDEWTVENIALTETVTSEGTVNDSLASKTADEWVTIEVSVPMSMSDFKYPDGSAASTAMTGFTIHATDALEGTVDLAEVKVDTTIIENFARDAIGAPMGDGYWCGTVGTHVRRVVELSGTAGTYTYNKAVALGKNNLGLKLQGDLSGMSIQGLVGGVATGAKVAATELVDHNLVAIPEKLESLQSIAINLEGSGLETGLEGVIISYSGSETLVLAQVFASDCISRAPINEFRKLNLDTASALNKFDFTYSDPLPEAYAEAPAKLKENGINFVSNWGKTSGIEFDGSNLVLKEAESLGNLFFGFNAPEVRDYFVISYKVVAEEGETASLGDFRFTIGGHGAIYYNSALADFGLNSNRATDYNGNYTTEEGYSFLVLSREEMGITEEHLNGEMNFYWENVNGDILIDEIFTADAADYDGAVTEIGTNDAIGDGGYQYVGYVPQETKALKLDFTAGDEGGTLATFRLQQEGVTDYLWLKDSLLIGLDGNPIDPTTTLGANETVSIVIDLEKTGYNPFVGAHFHSFYDAENGLASVKVSTVSMHSRDSQLGETKLALNGGENPVHAYCGAANFDKGFSGRYLALTITNNEDETITNGLLELRFEFNEGGVRWFNPGQADKLVFVGGTPSMDIEASNTTLYLDLVASNIDPLKLQGFHIHNTPGDNLGKDVTLGDVRIVRDMSVNEAGKLPVFDTTAPEVTLTTDKDAYNLGDEVTINVVATDDMTEAANLDIETKVTHGSGDDLEEVAVTDNKFTATKEGTYTITVTVTDEAGNQTVKVKEITVTSSTPGGDDSSDTGTTTAPNPGTSTSDGGETSAPEEPGDGLSGGEIAGITIGSVAGAALIGLAIFFLLKRK